MGSPYKRMPTPTMALHPPHLLDNEKLEQYDRYGREKNPLSDGLRARYTEVLAVAMLLGEFRPVLCSCCMGRGTTKGILFNKACLQCKNTGYDYIGGKTHRYFTTRRTGESNE